MALLRDYHAAIGENPRPGGEGKALRIRAGKLRHRGGSVGGLLRLERG